MDEVVGQIKGISARKMQGSYEQCMLMIFTTQSSCGASSDRAQSPLDQRPMVSRKALRSALGGWKGTED